MKAMNMSEMADIPQWSDILVVIHERFSVMGMGLFSVDHQ